MSSARPDTFDLAIERLRSKSPVAARLSSADWATVELGLRDRAFFSANVESIATVARLQQGIDKALTQPADETFMSRDKFIRDMRRFLGAPEGDTRDLRDLGSSSRLGLVYDFQMEDAMEYGRWQVSQDPDILDAFPCQELVRVESREQPRDWSARWASAGGQFFGGRMIARKDDPIWERISRFGRPWPPFDFGSGMGVENVNRSEAEDLGVIEPGDQIRPQEKDFNHKLEASLPVATPEALDAVKWVFGDQVDVNREGKIIWQGQRMLRLVDQAIKDPVSKLSLSLGSATPQAVALDQSLEGAELVLTADDVRHALRLHGAGENDPSQRPLTALDFQLIPHVWRNPDSVIAGKVEGSLEISRSILGKQTVVAFDRQGKSNRWGVKTLWVKKKGGTP